MRPRHKAAENYGDPEFDWTRLDASMRPRHKAAENRAPGVSSITASMCFNEAAA